MNRSGIKKIFGMPGASAILLTVAVVLVFSIGTNGSWLRSLPGFFEFVAPVAIITVGQAVLLISGEVDLSVGAGYAIIGLVFIYLTSAGVGVIVSVLIAMALSVVMGLIHSVISLRLRVPSMIATLGAMFLYRGLAFIITNGSSLHFKSEVKGHWLIQFLGGEILGIRTSIPILILIAVLFICLLAFSRFGNHLMAAGRDPASALTCGISSTRIKTISFTVCSVLTGLASIIIACQEKEIYSSTGTDMELQVIAAAIIGGCLLTGGIGSIWGALLGIFSIRSLKGGLLMLHADPYAYRLLVGLVFVGFMIISNLLIRGIHGKSD